MKILRNWVEWVLAGPRGFEPLVFGFLPPLRPEADALIRAGLRAPFFQNRIFFQI
jgi:hypothetical protein